MSPVITNTPKVKIIFHHRLILHVFELHVNGTTQHVLLCVWLLLLNVRSARSSLWLRHPWCIHGVVSRSDLFLFSLLRSIQVCESATSYPSIWVVYSILVLNFIRSLGWDEIIIIFRHLCLKTFIGRLTMACQVYLFS